MSEIPYANVVISGVDAFGFLQAQLATDVSLISGDTALLSTWCNPKGRVICLPSVTVSDGSYALAMPADLAAPVAERLKQFRFRARVDIGIQAAGSVSDAERLALLRDGIAEISLAQSEKFTPHMLNLDLLQLVSLSKGCYPGQEIVARTHYRGASKRRLRRFESSAPVSPGAKVSDGERDIGEVVNAIGTALLAVVPVDKADQSLRVDSALLTPVALGSSD